MLEEDMIPPPGSYGNPGQELIGSSGPAYTMRPRLEPLRPDDIPGPGGGAADDADAGIGVVRDCCVVMCRRVVMCLAWVCDSPIDADAASCQSHFASACYS